MRSLCSLSPLHEAKLTFLSNYYFSEGAIYTSYKRTCQDISKQCFNLRFYDTSEHIAKANKFAPSSLEQAHPGCFFLFNFSNKKIFPIFQIFLEKMN